MMFVHLLLLFFISNVSFAEVYPTVCLEQGGACYKGAWFNSPSNGVRYATFQGKKIYAVLGIVMKFFYQP